MAATSKQCYYETLGVERDATADDIKLAYRRIAKKSHPDRHVNAPDEEKTSAAETFKAAAEAYEVIGDVEKRSKYDTYGFAGIGSATGAADAAAQEMFEEMFGMGGGVPRKPQGVVSPTLFYDTERGSFFQRRVPTADIAMNEVKEDTLPEVATMVASGQGQYVASALLPAGPWEVKLVDVEDGTLTVVCGVDEASETEGASALAELNAELKAALRVTRPFAVPADGDALSADVTVADGAVCVRMPSKQAREAVANDATVEAGDALNIGVRVVLTGLSRAELNGHEGTVVGAEHNARLGVLVDGEARPMAIKRGNLRMAFEDATGFSDANDDPASVMTPVDTCANTAEQVSEGGKTSTRRTSKQRKKAKRAAAKRNAEAIAMEIDLEEAVREVAV